MDKLKALTLSLFLLLCFSLVQTVEGQARATDTPIFIENTGSLGFQNLFTAIYYITLNVDTGNLNTSANTIYLSEGSGRFRFISNESFTMTINFNFHEVKVQGDSGNPQRLIETGDTFTILAANDVLIIWRVELQPFLPVMFLFGMTGLGAMFAGVLYPIVLIRKKDYFEAGRMFLIFFFLGLGLFMAWVFL